jgi:hypothetical protein
MRLILALVACTPLAMTQPTSFGAADAARFARLALDCVHREYPGKISHVLNGESDVAAPRTLTPVFYGCYDWHSAVHGHWLLVRLCRVFPEAPFVADARAALGKSFRAEAVAAEVRYLDGKGREPFERPYGLAWLLQLAAELAGWDDPDARSWAATLEPLEERAAARFLAWLPKLSHPIRTGEHSQTAFALGLVHDWALARDRPDVATLVRERALAFHLDDRAGPLAYEPSGQDFLSPCLAEADLMRRFLARPAFAAWLGRFLPDIPLEESSAWLPVAVVTDKTDGKLAHLDGLNLSRAWMLEGMAQGLPDGDPRRPSLLATAKTHREAGIAAVTGEHYAGSHWLGSFSIYLVTGRGLRP